MTHSQWVLVAAVVVLGLIAVIHAVKEALVPMLWAIAAALVVFAFVIK